MPTTPTEEQPAEQTAAQANPTTTTRTPAEILSLVAGGCAIATGNNNPAALSRAGNMPPRYRSRLIRWLNVNGAGADERARTLCAIIRTDVKTTKVKKPDDSEVSISKAQDPKFVETEVADVIAGILTLTRAEGVVWILSKHRIWEMVNKESLAAEVSKICRALAEACNVRIKITGKQAAEIIKSASLVAGDVIPLQCHRLVAFADGWGWDVHAAREMTRRRITAADGIRFAIDLPCPHCIPENPRNLLESWFGPGQENDADLFSRWLGLTVSGRNTSKKIMIVEGPSNGGKGGLLEICTALFWRECGSIRTDHLASRFEFSQLAGFQVGTDLEAQPGALMTAGASLLKTITGSDRKRCEIKNQTGGVARRFAMHVVVATNGVQEVKDVSGDAFITRLIRVQIPKLETVIEDFDLVWVAEHKEEAGGWIVRNARRASLEVASPSGLVMTQEQKDAVLELTGPSGDRLVKRFMATCKPEKEDRFSMSSPDLKARFERWAVANQITTKTIAEVKPGVLAAMYRAGFGRNSKNNGILVSWN